jgi:hypothetical protein
MATEDKPSRNEEEYFAKRDAELLKAKRAQLDVERAKAARSQHHMKCPKDGTDLQEREQSKVKVDVCPTCKGMWLDAGELEMLALVDRNPVRRVFDDLLKGLR